MRDDQAQALAAAARRVGDRWSLLLVAALLEGPRRFTELQEGCGIAPNILSSRLRQLEEATVVVAVPYSRRPLRRRYELTAAGRELGSALRLLAAWGNSHCEAGERAATRLRHAACGRAVEVRWFCPDCGQVLGPAAVTRLGK